MINTESHIITHNFWKPSWNLS